jgi:hypothetical protein
LRYGDAGPPWQETFSVTFAPADGTLLKNSTPTSSFTQDDINNGLIAYRETLGGTTSDSFAFSVSDPYGDTTANQHFQIHIA